MRKRFDRLAKQVLQVALGPRGEVLAEHQVSADPQALDVGFVPAAGPVAADVDLGQLGRMAVERCLFEASHDTPGTPDVLDCQRRQLTWWTELRRAARRGQDPAPVAVPVLWLLSSGRPDGALADLGCTPLDDWPVGIYTAPPGLRLRIVVLSELPRRRDTLLLRLLGTGTTLRAAARDLLALPPEAWERRIVLPLLVALRIEITADPDAPTAAQEDFIVNTQELVDAFRQEAFTEGVAKGQELADAFRRRAFDEGIEKGIEKGLRPLAHQFERRLDRALTAAEQTTLAARLATLGPERLGDVVLDLGADPLAAWLADPAAR